MPLSSARAFNDRFAVKAVQLCQMPSDPPLTSPLQVIHAVRDCDVPSLHAIGTKGLSRPLDYLYPVGTPGVGEILEDKLLPKTLFRDVRFYRLSGSNIILRQLPLHHL